MYIWIAGEYSLSATTDESSSSPFALPTAKLPPLEVEGDCVIRFGSVDRDGPFGVANGCGVVGMISFACYYRVKPMAKKIKTGPIPPVRDFLSEIWGHRVASDTKNYGAGGRSS